MTEHFCQDKKNGDYGELCEYAVPFIPSPFQREIQSVLLLFVTEQTVIKKIRITLSHKWLECCSHYKQNIKFYTFVFKTNNFVYENDRKQLIHVNWLCHSIWARMWYCPLKCFSHSSWFALFKNQTFRTERCICIYIKQRYTRTEQIRAEMYME